MFKRFMCFCVVVLAGMLLPIVSLFAQQLKDAESASHADSSAFYQVVDTYQYTGFKVIQFNLAVLSHYSYMLITGKEAVLVDPGRDIFAYLDMAKKEDVTIKGVLLTHSHADFVAGHLEMVKAASCPVYVNETSKVGYPCQAMKDGDTLTLDKVVVKFVATPGHTPDGMCLYVYSDGSKQMPELIFTGDTLFVGSVGRPDLLEGKMAAATLASMCFDTWTQKLSKVGDAVVIFPAHGAGSLCGAHLSDKPFSTIGEQKVSNPYFHYTSRSDFIAAVLDGLPEAPQYFKHNAALNKKGPELVDWKAALPQETTASLDITDVSKYYVVDLRSARDYAQGHIPNSVNIGIRGRFETWTGIMVPWEASLLVSGSAKEMEEALYRLHRVGYKAGVIAQESWQKAGLPVSKNVPVKAQELYQLMQKGEAPVIVDVRLPAEWMGMRIGNVINLPLNHLAESSGRLDAAYPVVAVCNSAYRSSMGIGILERKGFQKVSSLDGGSEAWIEAGLPVYKAEKKDGGMATPTAPQRRVHLPDRIAPAELKRLILDLPGTFELVDIRPVSAFVDFNLPGSHNVDIAELLNNPAYLTGAGALIIVDRDGSLSMMVAGILSQKTERVIKALHGGVEAYWAESELRPFITPGATGTMSVPQMSPAPRPSAPKVPETRPATPKKKSAGC